MKKYILLSFLFFLFSSFAAVDTDSDGVSDEKDICPRVYARSWSGCPTLISPVALKPLNACYQEQKNIIIARLQPICDEKNKLCPVISSVAWLQKCDPIFPVILRDGIPFVRWSVYIVGFTQ